MSTHSVSTTRVAPIPLTIGEKYALGMMIGKTMAPVDRERNAILLRWARETDHWDEVAALIAEQHAIWLLWLTQTQRQWQTLTRRPSKAAHHDSIAIREKYVRIHNGER